MAPIAEPLAPFAWHGEWDGFLEILDQTRLPDQMQTITCRDLETTWEAIRALRVRGAPAIGIAGAYALVLGLQAHADEAPDEVRRRMRAASARLRECRPTAVNLFAYLDRLEQAASEVDAATGREVVQHLLQETRAVAAENRAACLEMARHGADLLADGSGVLTHCNTGPLATAGVGTALGAIIEAHRAGKRLQVYVDETRPLWQGARLTTFELLRAGVPTTLICDSAAALLMRAGRIQTVVVGADRIAANGDTANKIGTYAAALAARAHQIPFYVVAPLATVDPAIESGEEIPIEVRDPDEVRQPSAAKDVPVYNPAFDVTPHELIAGLVTECGVLRPPFRAAIRATLDGQRR